MQTEPYIHSTFGSTQAEIHSREVFVGTQMVVLPAQDPLPTISVSYVRWLYESPGTGVGRKNPSREWIDSYRQRYVWIPCRLELHRAGADRWWRTTYLTGADAFRLTSAETVTIAGELWHFTQPFLHSNAVLLFAVSYPMRRNLVVDAGFDHGLTKSSTHWESFIGFTYLLPRRLWKK